MSKQGHKYSETVDSPVGELKIVWSDDGLHKIEFARMASRASRARGALPRKDGRRDRSIYAKALARYFSGELDALDRLPVVVEGTAFQRKVWTALREIPAGQTESYAGLAARIGHAGAARAVGSANGKNPIGIVIPCHRVIGAGGQLAGYAGGTDRKRWLLDHEGAEYRG